MDPLHFEMEVAKHVDDLLRMEKERRGRDPDELVFLGMADVANYYWCAMKSLLMSRENESLFFGAYLVDRVKYSLKLGYIDEIPDSMERWLDVGDEIKFEDVEKLLKERGEEKKGKIEELIGLSECVERGGELRYIVIRGGDLIIGAELNHCLNVAKAKGERFVIYVVGEIRDEYRKDLMEWARMNGVDVLGREELFAVDPLIRGEILEEEKAERYPTIRWNFRWGRYVLVGVPDGITDRFVYEFKTTKSEFLYRYLRYVAAAQSNLYGHFFRRRWRRVQIYIIETDEVKTSELETDSDSVFRLLRNFRDIDEGKEPISPREWKCKRCPYRDVCTIKGGVYGSDR